MFNSKKILFLGIFLATLSFLTGCGSKAVEKTLKNVEVEKVNSTVNNEVIHLVGNVEPEQTVKYAFQIAGKIKWIADKNSILHEGDLVAQLDDFDYKMAAANAGIQVQEAGTQVVKANKGADIEQIRIAESKVNQTGDIMSKAEDNYHKFQDLFKNGAIPQIQLDQAETNFVNARETWKQAQQALELVKKGASTEDKQLAVESSQAAKVGLQVASKQLGRTQLSVPAKMLVMDKLSEAGEIVAAGYPVVILGKIDTVKVEVGISEAMIGYFTPGEKLAVNFDAFPNENFYGVIKDISALPELSTRSYTLTINVRNPELKIKPGMVAKITYKKNKGNIFKVPLSAVITNNGQSTVFLLGLDNRSVQRKVVTGTIDDDQIAIIQGLKNGDKVVTAGGSYLSPGEEVRVLGGTP